MAYPRQQMQGYPGQQMPPRGPQAPQFTNAGPPPMMNMPQIPPGLEALYGTDRVVVKQQEEPMEIFTGIETPNRYQIFNGFGMPILFAYEATPAHLLGLGKHRPFTIIVMNPQGQQVMIVQSSVDIVARQVVIQVPPGNFVSTIYEEQGFFSSNFAIVNAMGGLLFKVMSPPQANFAVVGNVNFDIVSFDQITKVGQITKQWGGFFQEAYTDADTFGVFMSPTMDVLWKAVLIAATFVVDFEYYENTQR